MILSYVLSLQQKLKWSCPFLKACQVFSCLSQHLCNNGSFKNCSETWLMLTQNLTAFDWMETKTVFTPEWAVSSLLEAGIISNFSYIKCPWKLYLLVVFKIDLRNSGGSGVSCLVGSISFEMSQKISRRFLKVSITSSISCRHHRKRQHWWHLADISRS